MRQTAEAPASRHALRVTGLWPAAKPVTPFIGPEESGLEATLAPDVQHLVNPYAALPCAAALVDVDGVISLFGFDQPPLPRASGLVDGSRI